LLCALLDPLCSRRTDRSQNVYAGPANHVVFPRATAESSPWGFRLAVMRIHATLGIASGLLLATAAVTTDAQTNYIISEVFNGGPHGLQYVVRVACMRAETWDSRHPRTLVCYYKQRQPNVKSCPPNVQSCNA